MWCKTGVSSSEQGDKAKIGVRVTGFIAEAAIGQFLNPVLGDFLGGVVGERARQYIEDTALGELKKEGDS